MKLRKLLVLLLLLGAAFILSACGKQGIQGETGDAGLKGETGAQGDKGATGEAGAAGQKGESGANGVGIQFSYGSEGLLWKYIGATEWNVAVSYDDIFALLKSDEDFAFDYYVNPNLALDEGSPLMAHGNSLTMGATAFKTIGAALAKIKADAALPGYDGAALFVEAGTYAEELTIDVDDLTVLGPNHGIYAGGEESRRSEAILTKAINVAEGVKGFTLNGFKLIENGQVIVAKDVADLSFLYNVMEDYSKDGVVRVPIGAGDIVSNFSICYNYSESYKGARFIWLQNIDGLSACCNSITNPSAAGYDFINASGYVKGKVLVLGNTYNNSNQSFIYVKYVGVIDAVIAGNTVSKIKQTIIDFRNMKEDGANKFEIVGNYFEEAGCGWCPIRIRTADYDENDSVTVLLKDNIFIDCYYNDATPQFAEEPTADKKIYTVGKNYYSISGTAVTTLTDAHFCDAAESFETPYANEDDVPEYELPERILPLSKLEKQLAVIAEEFVEDFNTVTGADIGDISEFDTDYFDSDIVDTFGQNATMYAKWGWLFEALAELADEPSSDPTSSDFTWASNRGFFLANINGFFTQSIHEDTWLHNVSLDFTDPANVKAILAAYDAE